MTVIARDAVIYDHAVILTSVYAAWRGHHMLSIVMVALATQLHLHNAFYALPILLMSRSRQHLWLTAAGYTISTTLFTFAGLKMAKASNMSDYIYSTTGCQLFLLDLSPNIGLWWYLFIEMFDHFRPLFLAVFQLLLLAVIVPATLVMHRDPLFLTWFISAVLAVMKPYPTIGDIGMTINLALLQTPPLTARVGRGFTVAMLGAGALIGYFLTIVWYYWMVQGSGNSNFYYAGTLALNAVQMVVTVVVTRGWLRDTVLEMNPGVTVIYQK
jgi:phosphatidylinositol glycan class U